MYKKNQRARQPLLISDVNDLPERSLKYLKNSWADTFRREVFLRIPEDRFAVLYDPDPSRPNVPVNVLVGLDILKAGRGWSDEELYEHFLFDLQVRYALGCDNFGEGDFDLRTLYYFRKRVSEHALKSGENLFQVVFNQVTDEQIRKLGVKTDLQRMDSTQLLSNIADLSRLELLVEVLQRLHRLLSEADQVTYAEILAPYIHQSAGQYTYRIKGQEAVWEHIQQLGAVLHDLLGRLAETYREQPIYQVAQRFFDENFHRIEAEVQAKTNQEIQAGCLQSLDDLEASYRVKTRSN
jgi:F0F1-type ATP synthase delta subunit